MRVETVDDTDRFNQAWSNLRAGVDIMTAGGSYPSASMGVSMTRIDEDVLRAASVDISDALMNPLAQKLSEDPQCEVHAALAVAFSMGMLAGIEFQRLGGTTTT